MAKQWGFWLPDLQPQLPDCPVPIIEHELKRAAQEFLERTRAWVVVLPPIAVDAGTEEIEIDTFEDDQDLVRVSNVWYDGKRITITTSDALSASYGDNWQDHTGTPTAYLQDTPGIIRFYPVPSVAATSGIVVKAAVKPSESAAGLPDDIVVKYREAIAKGAKARLMLYSDKAWSNPDFGLKYETEFNSAVDKANSSAAASFGSSRMPARPKWC